MEKENFKPLVYDSRMSEAGMAQDSTFGSMASPFPPPAVTKTEKKFSNIAHGSEPDEKMTKLVSENFDLRLHCFHLNEKLRKLTSGADLSADLNRVAYLESRVESLTRDLEAKMRLLTEGSVALAQLDGQLSVVRHERDDAESRCAELRAQLDVHAPAAAAAGVASTSASSASAPADAAGAAGDLVEQRVLKMAGLLQGSWSRQQKLEAKLAKSEAEVARLKDLESAAAAACGIADLAELPDCVAELNRELAEANASLEHAGAAIESLQQQVAESRAEVDELNQLLAEYQQEVESLSAEKAAAAAHVAAASAASSQVNGSGIRRQVEGDGEASFWESVRLGELNRQPHHQQQTATASSTETGGGSVGLSGLVEGLGALSLMPSPPMSRRQVGGDDRDVGDAAASEFRQLLQQPEISAEARQCLNASGRRFYHLCATSLASSGGAGVRSSLYAAAAVAAVSAQPPVVDADMSVSELTGPGLMEQVSQLRTHSLPMSLDAAAGMSPGELCQLKGVFDRLLGQLLGAEAGLQAALSATLGNVSAAMLGGLTRSSFRDDSIAFSGGGLAGGVADVSMPATPGVRMIEEENALAIRNLQDHVAEVRQALTALGRVGVMFEAMLAGAVAEASRIEEAGGVEEAASMSRAPAASESTVLPAAPRGLSAASTLTEVTTCPSSSTAGVDNAAVVMEAGGSDLGERSLRLEDLLPSASLSASSASSTSSAAAPRQPQQSLPQQPQQLTSSALTTPNVAFESCASHLAALSSLSGSAEDADRLRRELSRLGEQLGCLESAKASLERENRRLRSDVDAAVAASDAAAEAASRCRTLEVELAAAADRGRTLADELQAALAEAELAHAETRELAANCDSLRAEMASLAEASSELRDECARLADEAASLEDQRASAVADKADLKLLAADLAEEKAALAAAVEEKSALLAESEAALAAKTAELATAEAALQVKVASLAEAEEMAAVLERACAELEAKLADAQGKAVQLEEVQAALDEKAARVAAAESAAEEKAVRLEEAQAALDEKAARVAVAEAAAEETVALLEQAESAAAEKTAQLAQAEEQHAEKAAQLAQAEEQHAEKAAQLAQAEEQHAEKAAQLAQAEEQHAEKVAQLAQAEEQHAEKVAQLAQAEEQHAKKAAQLAEVEEQLAEKAARLTKAESVLSEKAELLDMARAAVEEKAALLENAEAASAEQADAAAAEVAELRALLTAAIEERAGLEALTAALAEEKAAVEAELSGLRDEHGETRVQAEAARAETGAMQAELSELQAEVDRLRAATEVEADEVGDDRSCGEDEASAAPRVAAAAATPSTSQQQQQWRHAAEMAEVLANYRELTGKCERAISLSGELQSRAEELRTKLASRSKRLEAAQKSNSQLKAMLKKSDDTCNQLSLELKATKLEIEEKTALTEKLLLYIARLGGAPHMAVALATTAAAAAAATAAAAAAAASVDGSDIDGDDTSEAMSSTMASTAPGDETQREEARACSPSPAPSTAAVKAATAAATAIAWPEVAAAEITLHDALARVSLNCCGCGNGGTDSLARELRRALRDLRHLRSRLAQSLTDSRRLADRLVEADGRADELASIRRRLEETRWENERLKTEADAAKMAANKDSCPPHTNSACCRIEHLDQLKVEVSECRAAVDRAACQPEAASSRPLQRDLSSAARRAAAAVGMLADGFWRVSDEVAGATVTVDAAGRLEAAKAESLGLSRRCAAMRDRLMIDGPTEREFSDRLSSTETLLADAKRRLQLAETRQQQLQLQRNGGGNDANASV